MKLLSLKTTATGSAVIKTDYIYDVVDVQKLLSESKHTIRGIISSGAGGVGKSVITDLLGRLLAEALPSDEKTLILDFDTSHGSGIHDLVEPIYTTRSQMRTTKDWVDMILAGEKPTPLWDPKNPRGSIVQPVKYSGSNQKESNLLYLPMSPENRDEYLYDYEPPKKPAKPEKEEIKDKALYAEKLKDYKKDLEIYEKKLKIHTEFHKQLRQLRNQFDDYRIRFMLFDLAPGSNQSINAFFKTADFIFLVLDTTREGENQYKNYLTHMMKSISYLEYDTKSTSNGERIMIPRVHVLFNKADNMQKVQKLKEEMDRCARAKLFNAVRLKLDNKSEVNINDISVERLMEINEDFNKSLYMAYSKNTEQVSNFSFFSRVIFNESKLPDKLSTYPLGSNWNKHNLKTLEHLKDFMLHYRLWTAFKGKKVSDDDNYKSTISKFFEFIREDVLGYTDLKK